MLSPALSISIIPDIALAVNDSSTTVYVDGFNLYYGIVDAKWDDCKWLDIEALARRLLPDHVPDPIVKYFTAYISRPPGKVRRQVKYIEALEAHTSIEIIKGDYQDHDEECKQCHRTWKRGEEKMTDVAIATSIVDDCYQNVVEYVVVVSGDRDLVPALTLVKRRFPDKGIRVAFPPERVSKHLKDLEGVHPTFISRSKLLASQLPQEVVKEDGTVLGRPGVWS